MALPGGAGGGDAAAAAQRLAAVLQALGQTAPAPLSAAWPPAASPPHALGTTEGALAALGLTAGTSTAPATQQAPVVQQLPTAQPAGQLGAGVAAGQLASLLAPQLLAARQQAPVASASMGLLAGAGAASAPAGAALGGGLLAAAPPNSSNIAPALPSPPLLTNSAVLALAEHIQKAREAGALAASLMAKSGGHGAAGAAGTALPGQQLASAVAQARSGAPAASGMSAVPGLQPAPIAPSGAPATASSAPPPPPPSLQGLPQAAVETTAAVGTSAMPAPMQEPVKPCHLHTKPSQKCKFCQRALAAQQANEKRAEQAKAEGAEVSKKLTVNISPMLKEQVLKSSYYKSLLLIDRLDDFVEEIKKFVDSIDVYRAGSTLEPSCFICCVYRLVSLNHSDEELQQVVLDNEDSAIVRCVGFLFLRCVQPPDQLWDMLEEFMLDDAKLKFSDAGREVEITIGEYVEMLLLKEKYFNMPLPRLPMAVRRKLEERVAPLAQYRKRTRANRRVFAEKRRLDLPVEVCVQGRWMHGDAVEVVSRISSRIKVRVQLEDAGEEVLAHIGRIVLRGPAAAADRKSSRSRSRSRGRRRGYSPDWSRWKGKSDQEVVEELRQRARDEAVCADRKDYAKRPPRFDAGLAVQRERGSAEARMIEDETYVAPERSRRRQTQEEDAENERLKRRRTEEEEGRQRKLRDIFEKYGQSKANISGGSRSTDIDGPDTMRLG